MKTSIQSIVRRLTVLALLTSLLGSCGLPLTDAATRLAGDIETGAQRLRQSPARQLEIYHIPAAFPEGVSGRYEVTLQESLHHPRRGGSLLVGNLESYTYSLRGYNWSTSAHLNEVRVPRELHVVKPAGAPLWVLLERGPRGSIDVVGLR